MVVRLSKVIGMLRLRGITSKEIHGGASNENPPVYTKTSASFKSLLQSPGDFITYDGNG